MQDPRVKNNIALQQSNTHKEKLKDSPIYDNTDRKIAYRRNEPASCGKHQTSMICDVAITTVCDRAICEDALASHKSTSVRLFRARHPKKIQLPLPDLEIMRIQC